MSARMMPITFLTLARWTDSDIDIPSKLGGALGFTHPQDPINLPLSSMNKSNQISFKTMNCSGRIVPPDSIKAYGYGRVSSSRQAEENNSLPYQAKKIREFADDRGMLLDGIYEDEATAFSNESWKGRPGLLDALKACRENGAALLVLRADRLSRELSVLDLPGMADLVIWSVEDDCLLTMKELRAKIIAAGEEVERRRRDVVATMQRMRARGAKFGNEKNLAAAQRTGSIANMCRADENAEDLLRFLGEHPELQDLSWPKRAAALNTLGSCNRSRKSDAVGKPWTKDTLRGPWERAQGLREERGQFDCDECEQAATERPNGSGEAPAERRLAVSPMRPYRAFRRGKGTAQVADQSPSPAAASPSNLGRTNHRSRQGLAAPPFAGQGPDPPIACWLKKAPVHSALAGVILAWEKALMERFYSGELPCRTQGSYSKPRAGMSIIRLERGLTKTCVTWRSSRRN